MEIIPIIKNNNKVGQIIEYRRDDGKLHRIIGPAFKICEDNIWNYQWWENGNLIAIYLGLTEELFQCVNHSQYDLKKLLFKLKWKDYEQSISLNEIKTAIENSSRK